MCTALCLTFRLNFFPTIHSSEQASEVSVNTIPNLQMRKTKYRKVKQPLLPKMTQLYIEEPNLNQGAGSSAHLPLWLHSGPSEWDRPGHDHQFRPPPVSDLSKPLLLSEFPIPSLYKVERMRLPTREGSGEKMETIREKCTQ